MFYRYVVGSKYQMFGSLGKTGPIRRLSSFMLVLAFVVGRDREVGSFLDDGP